MGKNDIRLLSGSASRELLNKISRYLDVEPVDTYVGRFSDGEIRVQIKENIRGNNVYIIQSTNPPGDNIMELLLLIDAAKRASAKNITAVIPYFGYARQDRKDAPRVPISAKVMANLLQTVGASRVLTVDLHADQIQGFFDIPVDNLYAIPVFKEYLLKKFPGLNREEFVIVSPDAGGTRRARLFARKLGDLPIALIDKRRPRPNVAEVMNVIGEVEGKTAIIVDDIIDTGNSVRSAAIALKERGARNVFVLITHGIFSGKAKEILEDSPIDEIIVTDTIEGNDGRMPSIAKKISISSLMGEAIRRIHFSESLSVLFL